MRRGKKLEFDGNDFVNFDGFIVDWNDSPENIAEGFNQLLKLHGIEVLRHETDSDSYAFSIRRKVKK